MKNLRIHRVFPGLALVAAAPSPAWACAVCGLDNSVAYFFSFLFLIAMPFAVVGVIGGAFLVARKRRNLTN